MNAATAPQGVRAACLSCKTHGDQPTALPLWWPIADPDWTLLEVRVAAQAKDGTSFIVVRRVGAKRVGGVTSIIGAVSMPFTLVDTSAAAWCARFNVEDGALFLQMQGDADRDVTWNICVTSFESEAATMARAALRDGSDSAG